MVGHSKWSQVKHIKGPQDVKRGAAPGKWVKEITFAARIDYQGPPGNPRWHLVEETVHTQSMPEKNRERASKYDTLPGSPHFDDSEIFLARLAA